MTAKAALMEQHSYNELCVCGRSRPLPRRRRIDYVNEKVALRPGRPEDNVAVAAAAAAVLPSQTAWPVVQTRQYS